MLLHVGKYALAGLLPRQKEMALFSFFDACNLLWQREYQVIEGRAFCNNEDVVLSVAEALVRLEIEFPGVEMDLKLHFVYHIAEKIVVNGPPFLKCCFGTERMWKYLNSKITKKDTPEASIVSNYKVTRAANILAMNTAPLCSIAADSLDDDGLAIHLPGLGVQRLADPYMVPLERLRQAAVSTLIGKKTAKKLNHVDRVNLHRYYLVNDDAYRKAWDRFVVPYVASLPSSSRIVAGTYRFTPTQYKAALDAWSVWDPHSSEPALSEYERLVRHGPSMLADEYHAVSKGCLTLRRPLPKDKDDAPVTKDAAFFVKESGSSSIWFGTMKRVLVHQRPGTLSQDDMTTYLVEADWYPVWTGEVDSVVGVPRIPAAYTTPADGPFVDFGDIEEVPLSIVPHYCVASKKLVLHRDNHFWL